MTHDEVIERMKIANMYIEGRYETIRLTKGTVSNYISMAVVSGATEDEMVEMIVNNSRIRPMEAKEAVRKYLADQRNKAVIVKGKRYGSISEAARAMNVKRRSVEYMLEQGMAAYV